MKKNFFEILFLSSLLFSGCSSSLEQSPISIPAETLILTNSALKIDTECLDPLVTLEFPVAYSEDYNNPTQRQPVLPSGAWIKETKLPENIIYGFHFLDKDTVGFSGENIWVNGSIELGEHHYASAIAKYSIPNKAWSIYNSIADNETIVPRILFFAKDGTVWGIDVASSLRSGMGLRDEYPLFSRYNTTTDQFEFIEILDNPIFTNGEYVRRVREDSEGNIIFLRGNYIYRYNPSTSKISIIIEFPEESWIVDFVISSDGNIWTIDPLGSSFTLTKHNLNTKEYLPYEGSSLLYSFDDLLFEVPDRHLGRDVLFLDSHERLWVDDRGWLDELSADRQVWHRIIRSPIFIGVDVGPHEKPYYYWARPSEIFESSDGTFWFTVFSEGNIKLDPISGEWCMYTTYPSIIVEDNDKNVWQIAGGFLYKLELVP